MIGRTHELHEMEQHRIDTHVNVSLTYACSSIYTYVGTQPIHTCMQMVPAYISTNIICTNGVSISEQTDVYMYSIHLGSKHNASCANIVSKKCRCLWSHTQTVGALHCTSPCISRPSVASQLSGISTCTPAHMFKCSFLLMQPNINYQYMINQGTIHAKFYRKIHEQIHYT